MVLEHESECGSQWAAIESIAGKLGFSAETLRRWVRRTEADSGRRDGQTTYAWKVKKADAGLRSERDRRDALHEKLGVERQTPRSASLSPG